MHDSVLQFVKECAENRANVPWGNVLEVGSYDVNGSGRPLIEPLATSYLATDMRPGPGVDLVLDVCSPLMKRLHGVAAHDTFDLLVSLEMLEHVEDWRTAITNMKGVVRTGGYVMLTTRSKGFPLHDYPNDYWRFSVGSMFRIWADWDILHIKDDPQVAGVFIYARKPGIAPVDLNAIEVETP